MAKARDNGIDAVIKRAKARIPEKAAALARAATHAKPCKVCNGTGLVDAADDVLVCGHCR